MGMYADLIRLVLRVRPDMSPSDASTAVNEIRTTRTGWPAAGSPQPGARRAGIQNYVRQRLAIPLGR